MKKSLTIPILLFLAGLNGLLFFAPDPVTADEELKTCSIYMQTGECRCYHTIVEECTPETIQTDCEVQCALH